MAKEDNLKDLLTDVADAIREKKGTADLINPQDFGSEIRGIESGGTTPVLAKSIMDNTGNGINQISIVTLGADVTSINWNAFQYTGVKQFFLSDKLEIINGNAFHTCQSLTYISPFPKTLKRIGDFAFNYTGELYLLDFRNLESIPTIGNTSGMSSKKIVVPDALYDEWIVATNWASIANKIIKASEYEQMNE